jgi:hypothetical protein
MNMPLCCSKLLLVYLLLVCSVTSVIGNDGIPGINSIAQQPVVITSQPSDQTAEERHETTFTVQATGSLLRFQWLTNGTRVPSATGPSYTLSQPTLAMNGTIFHVVVSNSINSVTSAPARLTVVPDTRGPGVQRAHAAETNYLHLFFDELLLQSSATNRANYALKRVGSTNWIPVTNVLFGTAVVRLFPNQFLYPSNDYFVCISNITDRMTNVISPNPTCVGLAFTTISNIVPVSDVWRYNEISSVSDDWMMLDYNDDPLSPPYHWAEGYSTFWYSGQNVSPCWWQGTSLSTGPNTYYFRKRFVLNRTYPAETMTTFGYEVDDGAVFYVNGVEIYRTTNMPSGSINYSTQATRVDTSLCNSVVFSNLTHFVKGTNILAAEVHQAQELNPLFADVAFEARLTFTFDRTPSIPELVVTSSDTEIVITWEGSGWSLETAGSISGPWTRLFAPNNRYFDSFPPTGPRFFRLTVP